jgi:NADPH:quinone reductase-like Zn-dependent oxidoreductase
MAAEVKQWITTQDGVENLQMATGTVPPPGDNEVLVAIHTVSLNYRDTEGESEPPTSLIDICSIGR